jgi:hypothetical protein
MIFDVRIEQGDAEGPSLILLHYIPGKGYFNLLCADCSNDDDYPIVRKVAQLLNIGLFSTNIEW